jgi:hypothetical protein
MSKIRGAATTDNDVIMAQDKKRKGTGTTICLQCVFNWNNIASSHGTIVK